jgi:hypothetical protein
MKRSAAERRARRANAVTHKISLHDDHEAFDREMWSNVEPSERALYVFELSVIAARLRGFDGDQLRLQRSVASVKRGSG